jgi:excisionase family DNA binding protein
MVTDREGSDLVSIESAAARLGLRPVTVRQWANRRLIERVKLGRRVLISEREIARLISENTIPRLPERGAR